MIDVYITSAALAAAVYIDLRTRRIPNALTVSIAAIGLVVHGITSGLTGIVMGLAGLAVGLFLFVVPFVLGWMGGGDVKLMAAVGAVLGPERALYAALYSAVAGGVIALVVLGWDAIGRRRSPNSTASVPRESAQSDTGSPVSDFLDSPLPESVPTESSDPEPSAHESVAPAPFAWREAYPYALAIAAGTCVALFNPAGL